MNAGVQRVVSKRFLDAAFVQRSGAVVNGPPRDQTTAIRRVPLSLSKDLYFETRQ